jgi:hypothetical protein
MKELEQQCRAVLKQGRFNQNICFNLLDHIVDSSTTSGWWFNFKFIRDKLTYFVMHRVFHAGNQKVLMYDARKYVHNTRSFPPGRDAVETYLNKAEVKTALHATGKL